MKSVDRYSSQSSNSLQSINSILSDEANTSMLSYSSAAVVCKNPRPDSIHSIEVEANKVPIIEVETLENTKVPERDGGMESASQSLIDILDNVRPPNLRPPSVNHDLSSPRDYQGSEESLAESIAKSMASNPDIAGHMIKLPGGRVLQKHVDVSRIDVERQQKVR